MTQKNKEAASKDAKQEKSQSDSQKKMIEEAKAKGLDPKVFGG